MGWISDGMAAEAGRCARKAFEDGDRRLAYKFIEAGGGSRLTGPMSGIGGQLEAVEAEGWQLAEMTAVEGKSLTGRRLALVCLFRRSAAQAPAAGR